MVATAVWSPAMCCSIHPLTCQLWLSICNNSFCVLLLRSLLTQVCGWTSLLLFPVPYPYLTHKPPSPLKPSFSLDPPAPPHPLPPKFSVFPPEPQVCGTQGTPSRAMGRWWPAGSRTLSSSASSFASSVPSCPTVHSYSPNFKSHGLEALVQNSSFFGNQCLTGQLLLHLAKQT